MTIKPSDVKVPLKKVVTTIGGNVEVSLSKRSDFDTQAYQEFVAAYVAEVEGSTVEQASAQFNQYEDIILESAEAGELTPAQKKLPPFMQKIILKKMGKGKGGPDAENKKEQKSETGKDEKMEDSKAAGQKTKMLSKKDQTQTCPACESLNVGKGAGMEKKACATCEK